MASANRMSISFGNTKEDTRIYNYLKYEASNASALIRLLVGMYLDGKSIQGAVQQAEVVRVNPPTERKDLKQMIKDKMEEEGTDVAFGSENEEDLEELKRQQEIEERARNRFKRIGL